MEKKGFWFGGCNIEKKRKEITKAPLLHLLFSSLCFHFGWFWAFKKLEQYGHYKAEVTEKTQSKKRKINKKGQKQNQF